MLKLLIVDDEKLVRELIRLSVDWNQIGFTIVATAESAEEAIEMVEETHPDVVFTDVRMPEKTGLDLARIILKKYPEIKIVVISGYDEFSYVNEGLKLGIFDYILKPIAEEALYTVGCKVRDAVLEEQKHKEEFNLYKNEFERNYFEIREKAIMRLVYSLEVESVADNLRVFNIELHEDVFQVAILKYGLTEEFETECDLLESIQIRKYMDKFFEPYDHVFLFERRYQYIGIINNQSNIDFAKLCIELSNELVNKLSIQICIGVGGYYKDIRKLIVSYREAQNALKYSFAKKNGKCIFYNDIISDLNQEIDIRDSVIKNYNYYICMGMMNEAKAILKDIYDYVSRKNYSKDQAIFLTINLIIETYTAAKELKINMGNIENDRTKVISEVLKTTELSEMEISISILLDRLFDTFRKENENSNTNVVMNVESYIKEHYCDPEISLIQVSEMVYVNPNYLSRVFKKKTGKTFREYLLDVRMENAILLLRQTSLKSYEVAERVGIPDPNYFSTCFKKKFGYSVNEMDY